MKVLHINRNYLGTALHQNMVRMLTARGIESRVYVPAVNAAGGSVAPDDNVVVDACFKKIDRYFYGIKQHKILNSVKRCVDAGEYDIIHAYTLFTDGNCARSLSKETGRPYIVAVRNTDVNDFFKKLPYLRSRGVQIMRDASAVFFLSRAYMQNVLDRYVPAAYREKLKKKMYIIPNGIDNFWLENVLSEPCPERLERVSSKQLKILFAGRIDRNKNIGSIQKTVDALNAKGYRATLTVVGKVADQALCEELRRHSATTFLPPVQKEELINIYRAHDLFVMPSQYETFGLVYAEAMTQGLPVIYTEGQGFDGQFPEGEVGYRVKPFDIDSITDAAERIVRDYQTISRNAAEQSVKFRWNRIIDQYEAIYQSICGRKQ